MDVAVFEAGSVQGKTDARRRLSLRSASCPTYFAGRPLSQGAARVLIEATVKDAAGHAETRGEPITVSESPLLITAVPEGGTLIPNLENQVFILTSYPDGTPASASVKVHAAGITDQNVTTDDGGVAIIRLRPRAGSESLADRSQRQGGKPRIEHACNCKLARARTRFCCAPNTPFIAPATASQLRVFSTKKRGTAYVDVVKEGQTVLTRDLDIVNGQAELALTATPDLAGTRGFQRLPFRPRRPARRRSSAGLRAAGG